MRRKADSGVVPGWQWWSHIVVPDAVKKQCENEEDAIADMKAAQEKAAQSTVSNPVEENAELSAQQLPEVPVAADGFKVYDADELQIMLDDAKRQPDDIRVILNKNLHAARDLGQLRRLATVPEPAKLAIVRARFPNFSAVMDVVDRKVALAALSVEIEGLVPPILLTGSPGIGKTEFSKALATALGTHFFDIQFSSLTAGFALGGSDLSWGNGRPGTIFKELALGSVADPLCLLDELDKVQGNSKFSPVGPLYTLLEPASARQYKDEAIPLALDASRVQWIATANYPDEIEPALRSRFWECHIPDPTEEEVRLIARNIYSRLVNEAPWGRHFGQEVPEDVLAVLGRTTPRSLWKILNDAFGSAALAKRMVLMVNDLRLEKTKVSRSMGFY